jgi:UTP--glucose-1-phosphate uridylyltransferase
MSSPVKHENIVASIIEGKRYDIGNKLDFLKTTVEFALKRKEFAAPFEAFLRKTINDIDRSKEK